MRERRARIGPAQLVRPGASGMPRPIVGGARRALLGRRRPALPRHEQPGRVHEPRPPAPGASSRRSASRPSGSASSPPPGAPSRAPSSPSACSRSPGFEGGRVFFTLGGADANEHAVKFARQAIGQAARHRRHPRPLLPRRQLRGDGALAATRARARRSMPARFGVVHVAAALRLPLPVRQRDATPSAASARPRRSRERIDDRAPRASRPC